MKARIIKIVSKEYTLLTDQGERLDAIVMGKVRKQDAPVAGDLVETEFVNGRWVIQKILPRHNRLIRPAVANVDQAIIVMSVRDPDFSTALVDRLSFLIVHAGVAPLLCVTKTDLGIPEEVEKAIREYEQGPMKVIRTAKGSLDPSLASVLERKISVLTGQSGAGKSTLLNLLTICQCIFHTKSWVYCFFRMLPDHLYRTISLFRQRFSIQQNFSLLGF